MTVTVDEIIRARADLAQIIETSPNGDKYWPIFERLEREIADRESRSGRLAAAKSAVKPTPPRQTARQ